MSHKPRITRNNNENGLYSQNVSNISTIMVDTQMPTVCPVSNDMAAGVRTDMLQVSNMCLVQRLQSDPRNK
jgi:hypothetical protein